MKQHVRSVYDLHQQLINSGGLIKAGDHYHSTLDYVFSSPSTAASAVLIFIWQFRLNHTMKFHSYIGIDYSGAQTTESRLDGLQVYRASRDGEPVKISTPTQNAKNWSRLEGVCDDQRIASTSLR